METERSPVASESEPVRKPAKSTKSKQETNGTNESTQPVRKRNYIPKKGSGGYAILIALLLSERDGNREELNKQELIELAQHHADESMTRPKADSHYTAFNSMKTLISNQLVESHQSRNAFYRLTQSGRELAQKLVQYAEVKHINEITERNYPEPEIHEDDASSDVERVIDRHVLEAGTFEIVLLVDTREQFSGSDPATRKTAIVSELVKNDVAAEMRGLPAGDFLWVARRKRSATGNLNHSPELVLDYVIERKKADDLASSIVDGRFKEQKHRLKICGVRRPLYLIEGLVQADYSVPYKNLLQAVQNTQVVDGFDVKSTMNYSETISFLVEMTKQLSSRLMDMTLTSCTHSEITQEEKASNTFMTFGEFERGSRIIRNFSVKEMFLKHLMQFSGMTVVKAKVVTDQYSTLNHLMRAYEDCVTEKQKTKLLAQLKYGNMSRSVGPVLSKKVYDYYTYHQ